MRASVLLQQCTQKYHDGPRQYKAYLKNALGLKSICSDDDRS